jgi:hypothetical protein
MKKFPLMTPGKNEETNSLASMTFKGGMMPVPTKGLSMIILDIRSLKLSLAEGKKLEAEIRELLLQRLSKKVKNLKDLSIADLNSSVLGISFD